MANLARLLNKKTVRRLAGDQFYESGVDYLYQGRVASLQATPSGMLASVQGENVYQVRLGQAEGKLTHSCNCPIGEEGFFCKHCVAAALALLEGDAEAKALAKEPARGFSTAEAVEVLLSQDRKVLRKMLLRWAELNPWLEGRIFLHAANIDSPTAAWRAVLSTFHKNLNPSAFSSEEEWLESFLSCGDMLREGLELGMAAMIVDLCEAGLDVAATEIASICYPTEDGEDLLKMLQAIHLEACKRAKPNPIALAERLFEWEKRSIYDVFFDGVRTYRKVLGAEGLQRTRELAEQLWNKSKSKGPKNKDVITALMVLESLAQMTGTLDDQAAALAMDLSAPHRYRMIAEFFQRKGRVDEAIEWLERGRRAFPLDADPNLGVMLMQLYTVAKRGDEAAAVALEVFEASPSVESFAILQAFAGKRPDWQQWAEKAVASARKEKAKPNGNLAMTSLLVEILTHLGRLDEAWEEAEGGFLAPQVWLALADASVETHPVYAGGVYMRYVERELKGEGSSIRYKRAVALMEQCAACMQRAGKTLEFMLALQALRHKHKRRRKLQELIEKRWKYLDLRPKST